MFIGLAVLALPGLARAHQSPAGCNTNDLDADISVPAIFTGGAPCGTMVPFTTVVSNGVTAGACDITDLPVTFTCPNVATGAPTGPMTTLATADDFTAVPPSSKTYPPVSCQIGDTSSGTCVCGAPAYQVQVRAGIGVLHLNPLDIDIADITKTLSIPCLGLNLPRHYQCFELKPARAPGETVTTEDQFGSTVASLRAPDRLCNPTNKNDEDPQAPADPNHLMGYEIGDADTPYLPVKGVQVTNQFGTITVDLKRLIRLFTPSSKSLVQPPGPLANPMAIEHYNCYRVERTSGTPPFVPVPGVELEDQFGTVTVTVTDPRFLCAPANKNNEDPSAPDEPGHLMCYLPTHPRERIDISPVFVEDQFGPRVERVIRRDELCVPSQVVVP